MKPILLIMLMTIVGCCGNNRKPQRVLRPIEPVIEPDISEVRSNDGAMLRATRMAPVIKEIDSVLKSEHNKWRMQRAIAIILSMRDENLFREDDLNFFMYELREVMKQELDSDEKQKLKAIYDREQAWMTERRKARQKNGPSKR